MDSQLLNGTNKLTDLHNLVVDYTDGDVAIFDNVKDLSRIYSMSGMINLIALCTKGVMSVTINNKHLEIHAGDVLFFPPNVRMANCECGDDFDCKVLCLSNHIIQGLLRDKIDIWNHTVYIHQTYLIHMSEICKEEFNSYYALLISKIHKRDTAAHHEIMQSIIRALLLELCLILEQKRGEKENAKTSNVSQGKQLFNKFLNLISNSEIKRQPIMSYADQLAITPKYLTMLCLKYSDKTASDWIILYTVEDIRFYLKNTTLSIKEISANLGFSNMSHFGSYVRKHLGMSPSEYRLRQQKAK